jgi:hypothetical protein
MIKYIPETYPNTTGTVLPTIRIILVSVIICHEGVSKGHFFLFCIYAVQEWIGIKSGISFSLLG